MTDLLKKIIPVLEIDYKKLTSNIEQRRSFRAHIIRATQNALRTEKIDDEAGIKNNLELVEVGINLNINDKKSKFINVPRNSDKDKKINNFPIQGEDETGRNLAMTSFQKIEKVIVDSYKTLSNLNDKNLYYDYLLANFVLWFDRFETELQANIKEPKIS